VYACPPSRVPSLRETAHVYYGAATTLAIAKRVQCYQSFDHSRLHIHTTTAYTHSTQHIARA